MLQNRKGILTMIFTASLNVPVKKALKKSVVPSTVNKICENLILDPETTRMTTVILGPKDFVGPKASQLQKALNNKHPDICVIYLYTSNDEADLCPNAFTEQARKLTDKVVLTAFEKYVGDHADETGQRVMSSADFDAPDDITATGGGIPMPGEEPGDDEWDTAPIQNRVPVPMPGVDTPPDIMGFGGGIPCPDDSPIPAPESFGIPVPPPAVLPTQPLTSEIPTPAAPMPAPFQVSGKAEDRLSRITNYQEWQLFKESLRHESVVQELVLQNSEYEGLVQMLEVLDTRIQSVWRDNTLSPDQKFTEIKRIGLQKSSMRAGLNSINVDKAISIISTIVLAAQRTVDDRLNSIDTSMYKISTDTEQIMDTTHIDKAIQERTKVQLELLEIGRGILDIYKSVTDFVNTEIQELDRNLPSSNAFINEMAKPIGTQIFTPTNTAALVKKISTALQENKLVWSQLEERVDQCIQTMFELCAADEKVIQYQAHVIELMRSNRVENVVVADTLLKKVLNVFTGADNTGRSATTITWSGVLSHRGNTLLLDLTGRSKFREYGITPILFNDFMANRIERQFLCVETRGKLDPADITDMVAQLRTRLNYYQYINVIVAPEDVDMLNQLCEDAFCVHFITNCSTQSINQLRTVVTMNNVQNVARKLIIIDTPISPLSIADNIGIDSSSTKLIPLPAMNELRACALKHDRPYDYPEIVRVFEEAFR